MSSLEPNKIAYLPLGGALRRIPMPKVAQSLNFIRGERMCSNPGYENLDTKMGFHSWVTVAL